MPDIAGTVTDMRRPRMLRAATLVFVLAADVATVMRSLRVAMRAMEAVHFTELAAVTGEVVPGIRTPDILGTAITV